MSKQTNKKKLLILAYACHPTNGSEPHLGWNAVKQLSKYYSITCLTTGNVEGQRDALEKTNIDDVTFAYADLPKVLEKRIDTNSHDLRYYLTQYFWRKEVRKLHKKHRFDAAIHATYARYWMPSSLAEIDIPKVYGPMGGGEKCPTALIKDFSLKNQISEKLRYLIPELIKLDPLFNYKKETWDYALGTTDESSQELRNLEFTNVRTRENIGVDFEELRQNINEGKPKAGSTTVKFVSIARIIYWKGLQYALKAMSKMDPTGWTYEIAGDGPYINELKRIVSDHNMKNVSFIGRIKRNEALQMLHKADALIHPSLHDSGSFVVQESMALNTFAIYLQCGGPHHLCSGKYGYGVRTDTTNLLLKDLQSILEKIVATPGSFKEKSANGSEIVSQNYTWDRYGPDMHRLLERAIDLRKSKPRILV